MRRQGTGAVLTKKAKRSSRALRRLQDEAADHIVEISRAMAPELSGDLVLSIEREDIEDGRRKAVLISASAVNPKTGVDYAKIMHESTYNLGPKSIEKNASGEHSVGRKYITRAVDYVLETMGYAQRARDAVRKGLK